MTWYFYAIFAAVVWGLDYSLGERIVQAKISPITILSLQMLIGSIIFLAVGWRNHWTTDIHNILHNKELLWLVLATLITFNMGNLFIFLSIQAKNATLACFIELSYPIFTILFTWLLFKNNHFNLYSIAGGILIFSGVCIMSLFSK